MSVVVEITDYRECPIYWQSFIDSLKLVSYLPGQNRTIEGARAEQREIIDKALVEYSAALHGDFGRHQCIFESDADFVLFKLRWS